MSRTTTRWRVWATIGLGVILTLGHASTLRAQVRAEPPRNPFTSSPQVLQEGMAAFRANCAYCHGMDARGMRAPDLTGVFSRGATEEGLYSLVRRGIPGTEMPPASVFLQEPDTWKVLMYLRTLAIDTRSEPERGNAENGERLFRTRCASCHRVERARRRARTRSVAHWREPHAHGARPSNSRRQRGDQARLRAGDGDHTGRTHGPRDAQERRHGVGADHGHQRTASGLREIRGAVGQRGARREEVADAGVRHRPATRGGARRPAPLPRLVTSGVLSHPLTSTRGSLFEGSYHAHTTLPHARRRVRVRRRGGEPLLSSRRATGQAVDRHGASS